MDTPNHAATPDELARAKKSRTAVPSGSISYALDADAIVGIDLDYELVDDSMLVVRANGTTLRPGQDADQRPESGRRQSV